MSKNPDAFRTISEVAEELDLPQHVLRFWETRFSQIKPMKRRGGRRYYRPDDVDLLRGIKALLYEEGYTIRGVQRMLKAKGNRLVRAQHPHHARRVGHARAGLWRRAGGGVEAEIAVVVPPYVPAQRPVLASARAHQRGDPAVEGRQAQHAVLVRAGEIAQ